MTQLYSYFHPRMVEKVEGKIELTPPYILPKHFEWVYVYIGAQTHRVGYVGRAQSASNCVNRLRDHFRDEWINVEPWEVVLYPCLNRFESEHIETVLINKYSARYNKDKCGWGLPLDEFFPDLEGANGFPIDLDNPPFYADLYYVKSATIERMLIEMEEREQELRKAMIESGDWIEEESKETKAN